MVRYGLPSAARGFQAIAPSQELSFSSDPLVQLAPASKNRLVSDLGVGLASFRGGDDQEPVWVVGKLGNKPPLLVGKLRTSSATPGRLVALAYRRQSQRQHPPQRSPRDGVGRKKLVGAMHQHAAKFEGL